MSLKNFAPDLTRPATTDQLARALGIATQIFEFIITRENPEEIYRLHRIPKRTKAKLPPVVVANPFGTPEIEVTGVDEGNYRIVWEPENPVVKLAHKSAARVLTQFLSRRVAGYPNPNSFGYVRGRSTRQNAARHQGARRLLGADIKNFFPSITVGTIELALRQAGMKAVCARSLARFVSVRGSLALGLNASPVVADLVAMPLDQSFSQIAVRLGCSYSRYADDITFSGVGSLPSRAEIESVLRANQFRANKTKYRWSKRGQKHYVTGLSVADAARPHVPRQMKQRLRQELHFIEKFGLDSHVSRLTSPHIRQNEINRIDGTVSYVASNEPLLSRNLRERWKRICEKEKIERSFEPRPLIQLREATWFFDEAEIEKPDGTKVLALCCAEPLEPAKLAVDLIQLFGEEAGDAFGTAAGMDILNKGMHWSTANAGQRERLTSYLATYPFKAFVAMDALEVGTYAETYKRLLGRLVSILLRTADDAVVTIFVESNASKVSEPQVLEAISRAYDALVAQNRRRPRVAPTVGVMHKGFSPVMSVPDAMLGALGGYAKSSVAASEAQKVILFERLRSRYSVILDDQLGQAFHARRPFRAW